MITPKTLVRSGLCLLLPLAAALAAGAAPATLADFQALAAKSNSQLVLPTYPVTPAEIKAQTEKTIKDADAAFDALAAQDPKTLNFQNTFVAADLIGGRVADTAQIIGTVAQSNPDKAMRDMANEMSVKLEEWGVGLDYREPLYRAFKTVADAKPKLDAEQQRLVDDTMRGYRRAGLSLPPAERADVERLRKVLANVGTQVAINLNEARAPLDFTAAELAGVPESFLASPGVKQPDGRYRVMANITWHAQVIGERADNPEVRRQVSIARGNLAKEKNTPVLAKLVALRADIAHRLGYANWADYRTEDRMAKSGAIALKFENDLVAGLQPKFDAELETLRQLKAAHTGKPDAKLDPWDIAYYTNKLKRE
jgi:Zn-dependent oligopeptidase